MSKNRKIYPARDGYSRMPDDDGRCPNCHNIMFPEYDVDVFLQRINGLFNVKFNARASSTSTPPVSERQRIRLSPELIYKCMRIIQSKKYPEFKTPHDVIRGCTDKILDILLEFGDLPEDELTMMLRQSLRVTSDIKHLQNALYLVERDIADIYQHSHSKEDIDEKINALMPNLPPKLQRHAKKLRDKYEDTTPFRGQNRKMVNRQNSPFLETFDDGYEGDTGNE